MLLPSSLLQDLNLSASPPSHHRLERSGKSLCLICRGSLTRRLLLRSNPRAGPIKLELEIARPILLRLAVRSCRVAREVVRREVGGSKDSGREAGAPASGRSNSASAGASSVSIGSAASSASSLSQASHSSLSSQLCSPSASVASSTSAHDNCWQRRCSGRLSGGRRASSAAGFIAMGATICLAVSFLGSGIVSAQKSYRSKVVASRTR